MSLQTTLFEFRTAPGKSPSATSDGVSLITEIDAVVKRYDFVSSGNQNSERAQFKIHTYCNQDGRSQCTVRFLPMGHVAVDVHECISPQVSVTFTEEKLEDLKESIASALGCDRSQRLPSICRGGDIPVYFPTTDGKLIEYDFDTTVFHAKSPFQDVRIMHSKQFGNMLLLDNDPNLAESDLTYTQAITGGDREDYRGKEVLILGGGDGGILDQLRHKGPKFITMLEIDPVVLEQARLHLRGICHDSLDQLTGENYQVIVGDCVPILKQFVAEKRVFDYVINDLTAIPVTTEATGDHWDFMRLILNLSIGVLDARGKYFTQGNGANMVNSLQMYENQLRKLRHPVEFRKETVCVPSYHELWVFYEIWKKSAG